MSWPTDLICSILPPGIEFPPSMADDLAGVECRLTFRSSTVDGRSRNGFRWPSSGWTGRVDADPSNLACSHGLHAAGSGGLRSCMEFGSGRRGELVAVPVDEIVHDADKIRFGRAYVVDVFDLPGLIRAGHFTRAYLTRAYLTRANLTRANLGGANLYGVNLVGANLGGVNLVGANLSGVNLTGADLRGANLSWADLRGAYLDGAYLYGADLYGADLYGATADHRTVWPDGFDVDAAGVVTT